MRISLAQRFGIGRQGLIDGLGHGPAVARESVLSKSHATKATRCIYCMSLGSISIRSSFLTRDHTWLTGFV